MNNDETAKSQISNGKSQKIPNSNSSNPKRFDLEDRTYAFAEKVRQFIRRLPKTIANGNDSLQLLRSSGSAGSNYIEANGALGKKDFLMRIKICKKESRESRFWLRLIFIDSDAEIQKVREELIQEAAELASIFGAIIRKFEK